MSTSWQPPCSQSLPYMHVQRWELARIPMGIARTEDESATIVPATRLYIYRLSFSLFHRFCSDDSSSIVKLEFTILLLVVSTCFIALNLPYFITWCLTISKRIHIVMFSSGTRATSSAHLRGTLYISKTIFSFNYCINFFLYSLTGVNFRRQLRTVFCRREAGSVSKTVASKTMYSQVAMATPTPSVTNGVTAV